MVKITSGINEAMSEGVRSFWSLNNLIFNLKFEEYRVVTPF